MVRDPKPWQEGRSGPCQLTLGITTEKSHQERVTMTAWPFLAWPPGPSWLGQPTHLGLATPPFLALQCPVAGNMALPCSEETEKAEKREKGEVKYR